MVQLTQQNWSRNSGGYGTMEPGTETHTISIDIAMPSDAGEELWILDARIVNAVRQWLHNEAPEGTQTTEVSTST